MLDAFKDMARWNMYGALGFIVCGGIGLIWAVILAWQQGLFGIFVVLALFFFPLQYLGYFHLQHAQ